MVAWRGCATCRCGDSPVRRGDGPGVDGLRQRANNLSMTIPRRAAVLATGAMLVLGGATYVSADETGKTYGDGVAIKRAVPIATLLEQPQAHAGKTVRVDGVVTKVCQAMGCWIEISDPAIGRGIRFKARDGVIVFPKDAPGHKVSAQGTFEEIATSPVRESHGEHAKSAENSGKPDPVTPAEKIYWVRVTGAVLY